MTITRRHVLKAALASAIAMPLTAMAAGADVSRVEYKGADDPAAFRAFIEEQSRDAVVVSVFHAAWCGPCKTLFKQLDDMRLQPGVKIKVIGLDVGPPNPTQSPFVNILRASQYKGTPQTEILAGGSSQFKTMGYFQNVPDMTRFVRDLTKAVHGDQADAPAAPRP